MVQIYYNSKPERWKQTTLFKYFESSSHFPFQLSPSWRTIASLCARQAEREDISTSRPSNKLDSPASFLASSCEDNCSKLPPEKNHLAAFFNILHIFMIRIKVLLSNVNNRNSQFVQPAKSLAWKKTISFFCFQIFVIKPYSHFFGKLPMGGLSHTCSNFWWEKCATLFTLDCANHLISSSTASDCFSKSSFSLLATICLPCSSLFNFNDSAF